MQFHPEKCNILSITQKRNPIILSYKLHDHILEKVNHAKYLGITLQSNLKWDKHINAITNNANQALWFLRRNLKISSSKVKNHAYKDIVRPKLEYSFSVWDPDSKAQINQLEKVQRHAARFVTNRYHSASSGTNMIDTLNWPTLEARRTKFRLIMLYKIIHHVVAISPPDNLLVPDDRRSRLSRDHGLRHIHTSKDSYKFSFYQEQSSNGIHYLPIYMRQPQ
jgi:hypothetical protein